MGPDDAPLTLACWGSSLGPVAEAVARLNAGSTPARLVHFSELWPFPAKAVARSLGRPKKLVMVEMNATGQFNRLLRQETGITADHLVLKYDGAPLTPEYILRALDGPRLRSCCAAAGFISRHRERLVSGLRQFPHAQGLQAGPGGAGNSARGNRLVVSGIGQSGKFPHYLKCNTINGIHGRTLPVATGIAPGQSRAQSGGHGRETATATARGATTSWPRCGSNPDLTLVVHNNQVYALTKGQASPTTDQGAKTLLQPHGVPYPPLHALAIAVAQDCSWVGRGFAGRGEHLAGLYKQALTHKGFALLEVLQPCVSFNKVNTFQWYEQRVYEVEAEPDYDPENELWAYQKAKEWGDRIPLGVIYRRPRPTLEEAHPVLKDGPLVRQQPERSVAALLADFILRGTDHDGRKTNPVLGYPEGTQSHLAGGRLRLQDGALDLSAHLGRGDRALFRLRHLLSPGLSG